MTFEKPFDRITCEENKRFGKPCIRGMRITVVNVLSVVATFKDRTKLFENYPGLEEEDIDQALHFAQIALLNMRMPTQSTDEDGYPLIEWTPRSRFIMPPADFISPNDSPPVP